MLTAHMNSFDDFIYFPHDFPEYMPTSEDDSKHMTKSFLFLSPVVGCIAIYGVCMSIYLVSDEIAFGRDSNHDICDGFYVKLAVFYNLTILSM